MIKFWKDDFKYIERLETWNGLCYRFSVCGESSNYLMNTYQLKYPNITVHFYITDKSMSIRNKSNDGLNIHSTDIEDDDYEELLNILQEEVRIDQINYEEYLCDSEYNTRDSRWK